jgi:hypothetical protein
MHKPIKKIFLFLIFKFSEPNIKGARAKVSTWKETDEATNVFKAKSYTDKFKVYIKVF